MFIANYLFQGRSRIGWPGYDRQAWQWEPITYGTGAAHDPSPPIIIEDAPAAPVANLLLRMVMGVGV